MNYHLIHRGQYALFINPETDEIATSIEGASKILAMSPEEIKNKLYSMTALLKESYPVITPDGISNYDIISSSELFELMLWNDINLARESGAEGTRMLLLNLAGYTPEPKLIELPNRRGNKPVQISTKLPIHPTETL
jgi:hypothetical protein